jgi:hypothetical protein
VGMWMASPRLVTLATVASPRLVTLATVAF